MRNFQIKPAQISVLSCRISSPRFAFDRFRCNSDLRRCCFFSIPVKDTVENVNSENKARTTNRKNTNQKTELMPDHDFPISTQNSPATRLTDNPLMVMQSQGRRRELAFAPAVQKTVPAWSELGVRSFIIKPGQLVIVPEDKEEQ